MLTLYVACSRVHAAGGVPCDMILKLPCGVELPVLRQSLQLASPFFRDALEDVSGSAPIPVRQCAHEWHRIAVCAIVTVALAG
jgi:hypothetical protein